MQLGGIAFQRSTHDFTWDVACNTDTDNDIDTNGAEVGVGVGVGLGVGLSAPDRNDAPSDRD